HVTNFATGCIYEYNNDPEKNIIDHEADCHRFKEEDEPNFHGSHYSKTKIIAEKLLHPYYDDACLTLRVRMPLADDLVPRNFITKITKYEKVVNVPNSMTVLYDLLP